MQSDRAVETMGLLSPLAIDHAVDLLADTDRRVFLHGGRFSHLIAMNFAFHLEQLRQQVGLLADPTGQDLGTVLDLRRGDVIVLFDYHRYQRSAAELARNAHRAGALVILITDDLGCPVALDAEVVLAAASTAGTAYHSMTAGFLLTELLVQLIMDAIGEPARTRMALWEEQRWAELIYPTTDQESRPDKT
jgi:DNA-binding MurR/RpiR family transcriptional regulator